MRNKQVRRLPIGDGAGKLVGVVSLNDLALAGGRARAVRAEIHLTRLAEHTGAKGASKATVVIEESLSGKSSRKSTRASANKQKSSSVLEHVMQMKGATAQSRHNRRGG